MQKRFSKGRVQASLEYLTTYGVAILIIVVVLATLYQLNVFSFGDLTPRSQPGACQVVRPSGPWSNINVHLQGLCSGELPKFVESFDPLTGGHIEGRPNALFGPNYYTNGYTISTWVKYSQVQPNVCVFLSEFNNFTYSNVNVPLFGIISGCSSSFSQPYGFIKPSIATQTEYDVYGPVVNRGEWYNIVVTWSTNSNTQNLKFYLNGTYIRSASAPNTIDGFQVPDIIIGFGFNGSQSNIQIYNTSLSANQIAAIYQGGIGGPPTDLSNLAAWYPLNGNGNDYSGNGNSGALLGGNSYSSQWTSGYTQT